MTPIAVVGIDCRFPGASGTQEFWRLLMDGVVTDTEVPLQRWDINTHYHPDGVPGSMNTRRGHFMADVDAFDNEFFGIAPIEAAALDPQQRLLLQASWRALEDAGINPGSLAGTQTGVFVGMMSSEWGSLQMLDLTGVTALSGAGNGYFMSANRISYHLNLTGPSMAIDSACSSSLMAVHQGCAALRSGEADTVIAAGANLILTPALSIFYTQAGLSAADGRCKPFGLSADGIGRGEGVAAVVLRRLDDAIADNLPIYAVVKSSVATHDGRSNGITAPSRRAQVELMRRALRLAEVDAGQIAFVEAHGTGTVLGDMIEANALGDLHKSRADQPCLLGSVKGNIGHTEGSAGIASFIKACLALQRRVLPPTVFGAEANPGLRLEAQGLRLVQVPQTLPSTGALGAVSSFGLGGSNAHAVLESPPPAALPERRRQPDRCGVLTISAPSELALRRNAEVMAGALRDLDDQLVSSWCRATNVVKRSHRYRLALSGARGALADGLAGFLAGTRADTASSTAARKVPARVGLLCPGQGTQYPGMTRPLYDTNPVYRDHLDAVAAAVDRHVDSGLLPNGLLAAIFGRHPDLDHTSIAQPALFAVSYALGKVLLQSGIRPAFGIGHSVGELAVACLAGVLSVEDGARLSAIRGRLMGTLPSGGAMVALDLDVEQAQALIADESGCAIAAINGPRSLVIAGPTFALARAGAAARRMGGKAASLTVSHAFHSPLMEPVVADFRREVEGLTPGPSDFPLFSTVLGREVRGQEMDGGYWADQICSPVRFFEAMQAALASASVDYVAEAGPQSTLLTLARQSGLPAQTRSLTLCGGTASDGTELLNVAATLLRDGFSPDLSPLYGGVPDVPMPRIPLYTFDTTSRFWFDGRVVAPAPPTARPDSVPFVAPVSAPVEQRDPSTPQPATAETAVLALIAGIGGYSAQDVARSSRLGDDLGYDSLLQLRLFELLKAEYPELAQVALIEVLPNIHSVGDVVDFVVQRLGSAGVAR